MYATKNRKGFAMILAIFVIVLIAMGGMMLLGNLATGTKKIGDNYLRAQAQLLAQSATEYAVMRVQGYNDEAGGCLNNLAITVNDANGVNMFNITVSMLYAFEGTAPVGCSVLAQSTGQPTRLLVDTTVTSAAGIATEPIRIHRRSWEAF